MSEQIRFAFYVITLPCICAQYCIQPLFLHTKDLYIVSNLFLYTNEVMYDTISYVLHLIYLIAIH
jgi:hypothetical protein